MQGINTVLINSLSSVSLKLNFPFIPKLFLVLVVGPLEQQRTSNSKAHVPKCRMLAELPPWQQSNQIHPTISVSNICNKEEGMPTPPRAESLARMAITL